MAPTRRWKGRRTLQWLPELQASELLVAASALLCRHSLSFAVACTGVTALDWQESVVSTYVHSNIWADIQERTKGLCM